jgi:hypothetical protein
MSCEKFAAECMGEKRLIYLVSGGSKLASVAVTRSTLHLLSHIRSVIVWSARVGSV